MARLFLSHSSVNDAEAVAIHDWLAAEGWDDVFLDLDPERGIKARERWERALNEAASRCEAVLFLVSRAWLELALVPARIQPCAPAQQATVRRRHRGDTARRIAQGSDRAVADRRPRRRAGPRHIPGDPAAHSSGDARHLSREGLARLKGGLAKAGLDPRFFAWPPLGEPNRPPDRGLKPLEAEDAGIFWPRCAGRRRARQIARTARGASPRLLAVLGASGSGKSSFLRAGLLPRLARDDRNFLPLPLIRPERHAISGETGLVAALDAAMSTPEANYSRAAIRAAVAGGAEGCGRCCSASSIRPLPALSPTKRCAAPGLSLLGQRRRCRPVGGATGQPQ